MSPEHQGEYTRMHWDGRQDGIGEFESREHVLSVIVEVH